MLARRVSPAQRRPRAAPPGTSAPPACARRAPAPRAAAAAEAPAAADAAASPDDFYDILGVSPRASSKDIKRAYKALMKDFHPDLSSDEESTEFCILLNEIYETLMDADRRAAYDALAGFSASAVNPFADTSLPADQIIVDELSCIGCRNCCHVCPSTFAIEDDWGRARAMQQGADSLDKLQEAVDTCPVSCIHFVTATQLPLLEATMARMERAAVWVMMGAGNGGGGQDVFTEASIAWEKRQAEVRAKLQAEQEKAAWATWWGDVGGAASANWYASAAKATRRAAQQRYASAAGSDSEGASAAGSGSGSGSYDGGDAGYGGRDAARIAQLAARAARSARQWRSWQEMQARSKRLLLADSSSEDEAAAAAVAAPAGVRERGA